jgi:uncharacterized protein (DUF2249 family)
MSTHPVTTIDLREVAPRERHALIFRSFDALSVGQDLELVNDHDPLPLRYQLEDRCPGTLEWSYMTPGPALWRVRIGKRAAVGAPVSAGSCCSGGACCG